MTEQELKAHYGIKPCPNKSHDFDIGRLLMSFTWAEDYWSYLVGKNEQRPFIAFNRIKNPEGLKIYTIVVFKLLVQFGWAK